MVAVMTARTGRPALAALSASALLALTACSAGSGDAAGSSAASARATTTPAVAAQDAQDVASAAVARAGRAADATGAAGASARAAAFVGQGRRAADADAKLAAVSPQVGAANPALNTQSPTVLAVSQGKPPAVMVVQTVPVQGSLPQLGLLETDRTRGPWRVAATATMLPGTSIGTFAALSAGSRLLDPAKRSGLAVAPQALLQSYATGLAYPARKVSNPAYTSDDFAARVQQGAQEQARATAAYATFSQRHTVLPAATRVVRQADGSAVVFAVLERTDTFKVAKDRVLNAPKSFVALVPKQQKIDKRATMTTLEFLVLHVPKRSGKASLIAASEHLVAAQGS